MEIHNNLDFKLSFWGFFYPAFQRKINDKKELLESLVFFHFDKLKKTILQKRQLLAYGLVYRSLWTNGLEVKELGSRRVGCSKLDPVFHPSEFHQMSARNFWGLSGKE